MKTIKEYVKKNLDKKQYLRLMKETDNIELYFLDFFYSDEIDFYVYANLLSNIDFDYYELLKITEDDLMINSAYQLKNNTVLESDLLFLKLITKIDVPVSKEEYKKYKSFLSAMGKDDFLYEGTEKLLKEMKKKVY